MPSPLCARVPETERQHPAPLRFSFFCNKLGWLFLSNHAPFGKQVDLGRLILSACFAIDILACLGCFALGAFQDTPQKEVVMRRAIGARLFPARKCVKETKWLVVS